LDFTAEELWLFLPRGYLLTIAIEAPILVLGLSSGHSLPRRLLAGCWLTACTYPIVVLVLPLTVGLWWGKWAYLVVAETYALFAECLLFRVAFPGAESRVLVLRDMAVIAIANACSWMVGSWIQI
jgi:hypothetical protein